MALHISLIGTAWAQESTPEGDEEGRGPVPESGETHSEVGAGHGAEGEHGDAFPPFDPSLYASQLLWLAITFGVFYILMARIVVPRIGGILETRSDRISQDIDEAQRLREESDAAYAAYEHELAEARGRAHKIGQEARDKAKAEANAEREKVEAALAAKLEESEKQIAEITRKAMGEVNEIANSTTEAIVRRLLGKPATKAEIAKAIEGAAKGGVR